MNSGRNFIYTYNHAGERAVKSHGSMEGVYINGAPQGITFHETDEYTLYPASIISVNKNRFTKHYFIGDKRIASRIGSGSFNNVYGQNGSFLTAGQQDYAERLNQIETQREDYYRELGIAPGIPTMKGSYGDPENTGVGYNTIIKELGDHSVPAEWAQYVKHNTEADTAPGAPIQWDDPSDPETALPGYGFVADDNSEEETFYYHSDHLGSTSYITDKDGYITQYDAYLPYGELLVDEHSSSEEMPYKFNGKELDEETGLYYYGARYMNPVTSIWYGVDPMAIVLSPEKRKLFDRMSSTSPYVYCYSKPLTTIDVDGNIGIENVTGAIIGAFTEYLSIVGSKMLFEDKSFKQANQDLELKDFATIGMEAAWGAASGTVDGGISKLSKWIAKPRNRKIMMTVLEYGVDVVEDIINQCVAKTLDTDENVSIVATLASTLAQHGMGKYMSSKFLKKAIGQAENNMKNAERRLLDLKQRQSPHKRLIENAQKDYENARSEYLFLNSLDGISNSAKKNTGKVIEENIKNN